MIAARWSCLANSESHSGFKIRFRGKKKTLSNSFVLGQYEILSWD
mgnify:CR=1 FL=1